MGIYFERNSLISGNPAIYESIIFFASSRDIFNCDANPHSDIPYTIEKFIVFAARLKSFGTGSLSGILNIFLVDWIKRHS